MLKLGACRTRASWNLADTIPSHAATYALSHMLWQNDHWSMLTTRTTKSERMKDVKHPSSSHPVCACGQRARGARETHGRKGSSCGSFRAGQEPRPARRPLHCTHGKPSLPCNGQGGFPHDTTFQQSCPALTQCVVQCSARGWKTLFFPCSSPARASTLSFTHTLTNRMNGL